MSKRLAENGDYLHHAQKGGSRPEDPESPPELEMEGIEGELEDPYGDSESEGEIFEAGEDGRPDSEREAEVKDAMDIDQGTFIPGRSQLEAGQTLAPDPSTYELLHSLTTRWPCLSFDILHDSLGENRKTYPATVFAVAGTQADSTKPEDNEMIVMKLSGLSRMDRLGDDSDDEDSDDENAEAILETKLLPMMSTTNRIRAWQPGYSSKTLVAAMAESAEVIIHDITPHLAAFENPGTPLTSQQSKPLASLKMHRSEGYAIDWSPLASTGKLLTGDNDGKIFVTSANEGGKFVADTKPFSGHKSSVEDIQWSPSEASVFASASSDGTVRVWDIRSKSRKPAISVNVSATDVNVLSWSGLTTHLLATGADDGEWAVWDLRKFKDMGSGGGPPKSVASFNFHHEQVTSIEWHPTDDSVVAVAAGDNSLTLWDLAVELDDEESRDTAGVQDVPPQLLFQHHMNQVKECHWHPQIPGCVMATGGEGFGVFKTISV